MNPTLEHLVGPDVWKTVKELHALEAGIRAVRLELERTQAGRPISMLVEMVSTEFGVPVDAVRGRDRTQTVSMARQVAMALARELFVASASEVGRMFGRDHGTVLWAQRAVADAVVTDQTVARKVDALRQRLAAAAPQTVLPLVPGTTVKPAPPLNIAA